MSEEVDFYIMKLMPPPGADKAGVIGGGLVAYFKRSYPVQEEAIELFLSTQSWSEVPGTRQQLVLSYSQALTTVGSLGPAVLDEFRVQGFVMRICSHSEDDDGEFSVERFFQ